MTGSTGELIRSATGLNPGVDFTFAGPALTRESKRQMASMPRNVHYLQGDVIYPHIPDLLQTFDIGWIPHRVGQGEVGGDAIKLYEYRAAGLPRAFDAYYWCRGT